MNTRTHTPAEVLLVEDNPGDARLAQEVLEESPVSVNLHVVVDGVEAVAFLRRSGQYAEAPRPDLILLDLNLPRKNGREVLADIKADPELRRIPVIVLTTSDSDEDINLSYDLHANCYVKKPLDLEEFMAAVESATSFWLSTALLPPDGDSP